MVVELMASLAWMPDVAAVCTGDCIWLWDKTELCEHIYSLASLTLIPVLRRN